MKREKNAPTQSTTIQKVVSARHFVNGFLDYANNNGWHEPDTTREQWLYERGRLLAAYIKMQGMEPRNLPLKNGRWATRAAVNMFADAWNAKGII